MKLIPFIFSLILITSCAVLSQSIRFQEDELTITYQDLLNIKLNGKIKIDSIIDVDENETFNFLKPLGTPKDTVLEIVTGVGRLLTFYYEGLTLYYENLSNPDFELVMIEITEGASLVLPDGKVMKAHDRLSSVVVGNPTALANLESKNFVRINVFEQSYHSIQILQDSNGIIKITIYPN